MRRTAGGGGSAAEDGPPRIGSRHDASATSFRHENDGQLLPTVKPDHQSPFTTATDVVNSLNQALAEMMMAGYKDPNDPNIDKNRTEGVVSTTTNTTTSSSTSLSTKKTTSSYFELQKRLPDGSSRKATETELKAADMETKLKQVANHVSNLKTHQERMDFAERQRQYGNQLYEQHKYEEAIDVYLTCLTVVKPPPTSTSSSSPQEGGVGGDDRQTQDDTELSQNDPVEEDSRSLRRHDEEEVEKEEAGTGGEIGRSEGKGTLSSLLEDREQQLLFCKVMNNLAQSSLQLTWYKKAETFCTIALQHLQLEEQQQEGISQQHQQQKQQQQEGQQLEHSGNDDEQDEEDSPPLSSPVTTSAADRTTTDADNDDKWEQISKLYYKRGKARRLRGLYKQARSDLNQSLEWIKKISGGGGSNDANDTLPQQPQETNEPSVLMSSNVQTMKKAIEKDIRYVVQAAAEGRRNKQRQQTAMKRILSKPSKASSSSAPSSSASSSKAISSAPTIVENDGALDTCSDTASSPLYGTTNDATNNSNIRKRRAFSTLRSPADQARMREEQEHRDEDDDDDDEYRPPQYTYREYYLALIGRMARKVLDLIGDDEDNSDERYRQRSYTYNKGHVKSD